MLELELTEQFTRSYADSSELRDDVRVWRDQYRGNLPEKPEAWSSNVNIPATKAVVDTIAEQLQAVALSVEPIFEVEALSAEFDDEAPGEEAWLQYWCRRLRLSQKGALAIKDALITGTSWISTGVRSVRKSEGRAEGGEAYETVRAENLDAVPTIGYVTFEDMCLIPFRAPSFARAKGAFRRLWLRWADVKAAGGSFYEDAVARLEARWRNEAVQTQLQEQQGVGVSSAETLWAAEFECWEGVYRFAEKSDQEERELLVLVAFEIGTGTEAILLRCTDFRVSFGEEAPWPFHVVRQEPIPNSMWGGSVCETIRGIQAWMNATFNQATDGVSMTIAPPIALTPASQGMQRGWKWGPMQKWLITNPADVQVMSPGPGVAQGVAVAMGQMEFARQWLERSTGATDLAMAKPAEGRRTAFEIGAIVEAGNLKFEGMVARIEVGIEDGEGLESVAESLMNIIYRFLPREPIAYRLGEGKSAWRTSNPGAADGSYRFSVKGTSKIANPEIRFKRAMATMQAIGNEPFLAISPLDGPQALLEKIRRRWQAHVEYWQSLGHKTPTSFIGDEPQTLQEALSVAVVIAPDAAQNIIESMQGGGARPGGPAGGSAAAGLPGGGPAVPSGGRVGAPEPAQGLPGPAITPGMGAPLE